MRRPESALLPLLALLLAGRIACPPAAAADSPDESPRRKLETVEKALAASRAEQAAQAKQAAQLATEIASLRQQAVSAAQEAQQHEAMLTRLESKLAALGSEEQAKTAELAHQRAQQARLLMALEGLAASPPEGLLLSPGTPVEAMRGALLMGAAVPPIAERARALKDRLDALAALRAEIAATEAQHRSARDALAQDQSRIAALIARKTALQQSAAQGAADSGKRQLALAAQAHDLRQLIDRLDAAARQEAARRSAAEAKAERNQQASPPKPDDEAVAMVTAPPPVHVDPTKPPHIRSFAEARGAMVFPASGALIRRFGESDELGVASKGLSLETRPGAEVVAPFDGKVMFAGPFRGYGQILIIGHGDGYHSLLAGLDRVDCRVGQWLIAGEPVGVMPQGTEKPRLYFELRHNNQPINPLPWLLPRVEKVNG